jgi:hypothetical protein
LLHRAHPPALTLTTASTTGFGQIGVEAPAFA